MLTSATLVFFPTFISLDKVSWLRERYGIIQLLSKYSATSLRGKKYFLDKSDALHNNSSFLSPFIEEPCAIKSYNEAFDQLKHF